MKEEGLVLEIKEKVAKVRIERKDICSLCGACNMGLGKVMIAEVENLVGAKVGERVKVETDSPYYLKAVFMVYIFPLIGLIIGCIIGGKIASSELLIACFGITGLALSSGITYWYSKRLKRGGEQRSKIIKVIS